MPCTKRKIGGWLNLPLLMLAVQILTACGQVSQPPSVTLNVTVSSPDNHPLSDVSIALDGLHSGKTSDRGNWSSNLSGPDGRRIKISVTCPSGWLPRNENPKEIVVRFMVPIGAPSSTPSPINTRFFCTPAISLSLLVVRTDGRAGMGIRGFGRQIATTNVDGIAQALLEGNPGSEIEITLDTNAYPRLYPQMPSRRLTIPPTSQILIFDQDFNEQPKRRKQKHRRRTKAGPRRLIAN
jgi:hypothetical protein